MYRVSKFRIREKRAASRLPREANLSSRQEDSVCMYGQSRSLKAHRDKRLVALLLLGSWISALAGAQTKSPSSPLPLPLTAADASAKLIQAAGIPVRKVVLYKNGLGYFEHAGEVTGDAEISIDFTTSQLNDVLQSLTVLDEGGGHISGVGYNSTSPLDQQLKSLSLGLSADPSVADLFQALRGARVEVSGKGAAIIGRLMNVEERQEQDSGSDSSNVPRRYLTVVADSGTIRVIELTPATSVRLLDVELDKQLGRYLSMMSSARNTELRHLTLESRGQGRRELRESYISEVPVWKSTYRIVFPKDSSTSAILQGWAVIDNTVGSDLDNVQLSLVAGSPQSFVQPLSTPYYQRRPEIGLATAAMTIPQTHEGAIEPAGVAGFVAKQAPPSRSPMSQESVTVSGMHAPGIFGVVGGSGGGVFRASDAFEQGEVSTEGFDDYFEYSLSQPVTLHKNESALVPILQANVEAERVTLWNGNGGEPLRALWLTNSSNLMLDRGSFSIFENGSFAGEGLLDSIHAGDKRLLSYGVDPAVRVSPCEVQNARHLAHITLAKGVLTRSVSEIDDRTYTVSNSGSAARTVIVEQPRGPGLKLDPNSSLAETTPNLYRFMVTVQPHESVPLHVSERGTLSTTYSIEQNGDAGSRLLVSISGESPVVADALRPVLDAKRKLDEIEQKLKSNKANIEQLSTDEERVRDNIAALKGNGASDATRRFVEQLNRDEDQLQAARKQADDLIRERDAARDALANQLTNLNLDMDVASS